MNREVDSVTKTGEQEIIYEYVVKFKNGKAVHVFAPTVEYAIWRAKYYSQNGILPEDAV